MAGLKGRVRRTATKSWDGEAKLLLSWSAPAQPEPRPPGQPSARDGPDIRGARRRRRLPWQLLLHRGGVVHEGSHDHGGLLHVLGLDAVVDVLVRVVGPGFVFDLVL